MTELVIDRVFSRFGFNFTLKPEKRDITKFIVDGWDVMGVLPTGFGKSIAFVMIPLVLD